MPFNQPLLVLAESYRIEYFSKMYVDNYVYSDRSRKDDIAAARAKGTHTEAEWEALCKEVQGICLSCGELKPLTKDHIIAVSDGGSDAISNIQPLCKQCNSGKNNWHHSDYLNSWRKTKLAPDEYGIIMWMRHLKSRLNKTPSPSTYAWHLEIRKCKQDCNPLFKEFKAPDKSYRYIMSLCHPQLMPAIEWLETQEPESAYKRCLEMAALMRVRLERSKYNVPNIPEETTP